MFDLSTNRELNSGFGNALATAVELSVTPAIFAWLGWKLDGWAGTAPLFLVVFFLFTFCYVVWRQVVVYQGRMREQENELLHPKREGQAP